ncbi:MAG: SHOCT domain-containing protein [Actinobacteria bacterium]|nr:SHOCT domain-containing protein [Actinomycetota bacterium]
MPIIGRFGRPGLLGMAARTAVVAGTATAVSGAVANHQQERARARQQEQLMQEQFRQEQLVQEQERVAQQTPPGAPLSAAPAPDLVAKLQQLADLHAQGILTAEQFEQAKQQLLAG